MTSLPSAGPGVRGVVRLLNTTAGRMLCLAGVVDGAAVESFSQRYGREPAPIDVLDVGSVTVLSAAGAELVRDHLSAARAANRPVTVRGSAQLAQLLGETSASARRAFPAIVRTS